MDAKRCCGGGSATEMVPPAVWGSGDLKEAIAVKQVGPGGRRASEAGKWSRCGLVLGESGW